MEDIEYQEVTVGNEVILEPVYTEPIVVIGTGEDQVIMPLSQHLAEVASTAKTADPFAGLEGAK
jgi:hypothetical protein